MGEGGVPALSPRALDLRLKEKPECPDEADSVDSIEGPGSLIEHQSPRLSVCHCVLKVFVCRGAGGGATISGSLIFPGEAGALCLADCTAAARPQGAHGCTS